MAEKFDDFTRKFPDHYNNGNHCSNRNFDDLPFKSVEGVLNSMFEHGDRLEVFFEDEMFVSGGTFVATFDNILIWMDYDANVNITNVSGPISVRKMGSKKKKKMKHNNKDKNNTKQKRDNRNDRKKKDARKNNVTNDQTGINEELLNFVKLEKGEHEIERGPEENLISQRLHKDKETTENESFTEEILDSSVGEGEDGIYDSLDEKVVGNNLSSGEFSNDLEKEEEYTPQMEKDEVQFEEKNLDQGIENIESMEENSSEEDSDHSPLK